MKNTAYKDTVEAELTRHGVQKWTWGMRGKHEACYYTLPDGRCRFTIVPCTPGDHRGVLNKRSDVRKELRELGLVPLDKKPKGDLGAAVQAARGGDAPVGKRSYA